MTDWTDARQRVERLADRMAMSHAERFEAFAEQFYRDTGKIAPGRSMPIEMCQSDDDARRVAWEQWGEAERQANIAALRALVSRLGEAPVSREDREQALEEASRAGWLLADEAYNEQYNPHYDRERWLRDRDARPEMAKARRLLKLDPTPTEDR